MTQELLYTSAPRGLKPGSSGFCTVASTQGMAPPLASALESLSAYRHVFRHGDPQADQNPVVHSHVKLRAGGENSYVVSRVADYGQDYSGRTNKLAHHVALRMDERTPAGPARLLMQPHFMETEWDGEPRVLPAGRSAKQGGQANAGVCRHWQDMTGDAGWAGVLAENFLENPEQTAYIVFEPGMDLLPLFAEAIELLPPERRWDVSFSTFFTSLPRGVTCNWRCVLAGSAEANQSRRFVNALRIDLTQDLPPATGGALVEQARTGRAAQPTSSYADSSDGIEFASLDEGEKRRRPKKESTGTTYAIKSEPSKPGPPPPPPNMRQPRTRVPTHPDERNSVNTALLAVCGVVVMGLVAGVVFLVQTKKPENTPDQLAATDPGKSASLKTTPIERTTPVKTTAPVVAKTIQKTTPPKQVVAVVEEKTPERKTEVVENIGEPNKPPKKEPRADEKTKKTEEVKVAKNTPRETEPKNATPVEPAKKEVKGFVEVELPEAEDDPDRPATKRILLKTFDQFGNEPPKLSLYLPAANKVLKATQRDGEVEVSQGATTSLKLATFLMQQGRFNDNHWDLYLKIPKRPYTKGDWKKLKWCGIEVSAGERRQFLLLHKSVPARQLAFKERKLVWNSPLAIETDGVPFQLDHVKVEAAGKSFHFSQPKTPSDSSSGGGNQQVRLTDKTAESHPFTGHFDDFQKDDLQLLVKYETVGVDEGEISLQWTNGNVNSAWKAAKGRFFKFAQEEFKPHAKLLARIEPKAAKGDLQSYYSGEDIQGTIEKVASTDVKGAGKLAQTLRDLRSKATAMQSVYESLDSAKVVSAHISYQLKNSEGKTKQIDVVRIPAGNGIKK